MKPLNLLASTPLPTRDELRVRYAEWSTDELVRTARSSGLTEEARSVLEEELARRGVAIDTVSASPEKTTGDHTGAEFRVGRIFGQGFSIFFKNFIPFMLLAILVHSPLILTAAFVEPSQATGQTPPVWAGLAELAQLPLWLLLTATLTYGTFQELRSQRAGVGECVSNGLKRILPVLGVMIVLGVGTILAGSIVLLILGTETISVIILAGIFVIVFTALWVVVPVAVVENPGINKSIQRSMLLTGGHRWSILGIILLLGLVAVLAELVLQIPGAIIAVTAGFKIAQFSAVLSQVASAFTAALDSVVAAVCYYKLRAIKEGVDIQEIVAVFD